MIETNIKKVQERIKQACERSGRSVSEITLIAVSKTVLDYILSLFISSGS